jgi:hypothetical protein
MKPPHVLGVTYEEFISSGTSSQVLGSISCRSEFRVGVKKISIQVLSSNH